MITEILMTIADMILCFFKALFLKNLNNKKLKPASTAAPKPTIRIVFRLTS